MLRRMALLLPLVAIGGCTGNYMLTAPDQIAPAGGRAAVVVRIQREDLPRYYVPREGSVIDMRIGDGPVRAAYTDKLGYAGALVPVPAKPGVYPMTLHHGDREGDEVTTEVPTYVWDTKDPVVAIDADMLLAAKSPQDMPAAVAAVAAEAHVIYMTRRSVSEHCLLHKALAAAGYPDGPAMTWQSQRWQFIANASGIPMLVTEDRLANQLPFYKSAFPGLVYGIAADDVSLKAFEAAGLKPVALPAKDLTPENVRRRLHPQTQPSTTSAPASGPASKPTSGPATAPTSMPTSAERDRGLPLDGPPLRHADDKPRAVGPEISAPDADDGATTKKAP